jgi:hypothetical protein
LASEIKTVSFKIKAGLFVVIDKLILKFLWESKGQGIAKTKEQEGWRTHIV